MKILLSNDYGIYAPGLKAADETLRGVGEVMVVASDREQSGVGPSLTLRETRCGWQRCSRWSRACLLTPSKGPPLIA